MFLLFVVRNEQRIEGGRLVSPFESDRGRLTKIGPNFRQFRIIHGPWPGSSLPPFPWKTSKNGGRGRARINNTERAAYARSREGTTYGYGVCTATSIAQVDKKEPEGREGEGALSFSLSHYGPSYPSLTVALHIRVPGLRSTAATSRDHRSSTRYIDAGYINPPPLSIFRFRKTVCLSGNSGSIVHSSPNLREIRSLCPRSSINYP